MNYKVEFSKSAKKQIKKLDKATSAIIIAWIRKNIDGCSNPRAYGKALTGEYKDYWRYRVGDYRIISRISDKKITVLIFSVGHRREVYK